jgi:ABC-type antimicrobial peptide transport system ATPase subunit
MLFAGNECPRWNKEQLERRKIETIELEEDDPSDSDLRANTLEQSRIRRLGLARALDITRVQLNFAKWSYDCII